MDDNEPRNRSTRGRQSIGGAETSFSKFLKVIKLQSEIESDAEDCLRSPSSYSRDPKGGTSRDT